MSTSIVSELKESGLNSLLKELAETPEYKLLPHATEEKVDFRFVIVNANGKPVEIRKLLKTKKAKWLVVFARGRLNGQQKRAVFGGRTLSLHDITDPDDRKEAIERVCDELFLHKLLSSSPGIEGNLFHFFSSSARVAISILDRSFKTLYRNDEHRRIAGGPDGPFALCWQQFRKLHDQAIPCEGCPTAELYATGQIPEPRFMVWGKGAKGIMCTRLQVLPLVDQKRDRIVASVEIASKVEPQQYQGSRIRQEQLLEACLSRILDGAFTRSRIYVHVESIKSLRGFMQCSTDPSGNITDDFKDIVLPFKYNEQLFDEGMPSVRKYAKERFEGQLFSEVFQKNKAPVSLEIPLLDHGRKIGKLVADMYAPSGKPCRKIEAHEIDSIMPYIPFIRELLSGMLRLESLKLIDLLTESKERIVGGIRAAISIERVLETLVWLLPESMKGIVSSAFIRVPSKDGKKLIKTSWGSGPYWDFFAPNELSTDDGSYVSVHAYRTEWPIVAPVAKAERERLRKLYAKKYPLRPKYLERAFETKCSIPIVRDGQVVHVLCLQGTRWLSNQEVLECLQEIASVTATCYSRLTSSRAKQVLVLGRDSGQSLHRLNDIRAILNRSGYEAVLLKDRRDIPELSLEDKARVLADQCRFVILEGSFEGGHIVEARMCAINKTVTAILRDKNKPLNYMLSHYPLDFKFMKEFEYVPDPEQRDSLEAKVKKAIRWAEGIIKRRKKFFDKLYPWRGDENEPARLDS